MEKIKSVNIYRFGNSEDFKYSFNKRDMLEKKGYRVLIL